MRQVRKQSRSRGRTVYVEANASGAAYDRSLLSQAEALVDLISHLTR
jgi:hypothetical protein